MSRPQQRSLRAWALGFSLVVAVGSIGVLAYQAVGLDRSHRAVAEGVLRDYSAFAADQFSRLAAERITALSKTILAPVACGASPQVRRAAAVDRTAAAISIVRQPHCRRRVLRGRRCDRPHRVRNGRGRAQHSRSR